MPATFEVQVLTGPSRYPGLVNAVLAVKIVLRWRINDMMQGELTTETCHACLLLILSPFAEGHFLPKRILTSLFLENVRVSITDTTRDRRAIVPTLYSSTKLDPYETAAGVYPVNPGQYYDARLRGTWLDN